MEQSFNAYDGFRIIRLENAASTNSLLKESAEKEKLEEGTTLIVANQTAGRGQQGNSWESEAGKNLTFSMIFYPDFLPFKRYFLLSKVVALGVKNTLDEYISGIEIKWPNDIYYQEKKIAGILIENDITGYVITRSVVGIGLNVNQEKFSEEIPNPVSLKNILGKEVDIDSLLEKITENIISCYKELKNGNFETIASAYADALFRKSGFHTYADVQGVFKAKIDFVGDDGLINLTTEKGEKRSYAFKEVAFKMAKHSSFIIHNS
jgi:BirA family biotin operon repressor/biotin-[acetyl-CoA-carboxylase] ligase